MKKYKLAVLTSHPIQYQSPFFKKISEDQQIDLMVYFCCDFGAKEKKYDKEFGVELKWDIPLLEGFHYKFLKNYSPYPASDFWGQINPEIISELNFNKYDAIIVLGWNSLTNWLAFLTAFWIKIPVLLRGENPLNQEFSKSRLKIFVKKLILGEIFKKISAFLYIGEENKKFYKFYGVPEKKLFFAPYTVDNERLIIEAKRLRPSRDNLKVEMGIPLKSVVILFVGKLIEKKRPMDLLRAYELLSTKYKIQNIALVFVGDGELRGELEVYARERNISQVHFAGFRNQTELPKCYSLADIFVLPSGAGETWGLVVNEAMCFSLPVIVSDVVGCGSDLAEQDKNGYIFSLGNVGKLAQYLKDLAENTKKRNSFGRESFKIIQNYSYKENINGILGSLKNID